MLNELRQDEFGEKKINLIPRFIRYVTYKQKLFLSRVASVLDKLMKNFDHPTHSSIWNGLIAYVSKTKWTRMAFFSYILLPCRFLNFKEIAPILLFKFSSLGKHRNSSSSSSGPHPFRFF